MHSRAHSVPSSISLQAVSQAFSGEQQPPLHAHLASLARMSSISISDEASIGRGILAVAALFPFDPASQVQVDVSFAHHRPEWVEMSLLSAALRLSVSNRSTPPSRVRWSTDPVLHPEMQDSQARDRSVDMEWVAASLVVSGCNPWAGWNPDTDPLPHELALAIHLGMAGLVEMFLEHPDAPEPATLSSALLAAAPHSGLPPSPLWEVLMASAHGAKVLPVFLEKGLPFPEADILVPALREAVPLATEILSAHEAKIPLSKAQSKSVRSAWRARSKRGHLEPSKAEAMASHLWPDQDSHQMSAESVEIARLVSVPWTKAPSNNADYQPSSFMAGTGKALAAQASVASGPMAGEWSLLAAAAFSRVRQNTGLGAVGWSLPHMAGINSSLPDGALSGALGFDWRPGIAIDGALMLSVLSNRHAPCTTQDGLDEFARLTGVGDFARWKVASLESAARFSVAILSRPSMGALQAMASTWETSLHHLKDALPRLDPDLRADLFIALSHPMFNSKKASTFDRKNYRSLFTSFFPEVPMDRAMGTQDLLDLLGGASLGAARARLHLELSSYLHDAKAVKMVGAPAPSNSREDHVIAAAAAVGSPALDTIEAFWRALPDHDDSSRWLSLVEAKRMDLSTANPSPGKRAPRGTRL